MKKQALTLTSLLVVVGLLFSAFAVTPAQAAGRTPQEQSTSSALSPESLANATYKSELAASGEVTLVNGELLDEANSIYAALLPTPTATGVINGQETALVLLVENGGGSGIFINLAAMVDQDGVPVNVDTTLLGDRVDVTSLTIDGDQIVVEMVAQGPDDPMCCPTQLVRQTYTINGDQFVQVSEEVIGSVPQVIIEKPIGDYRSAVIPASPYDNTQPPMLTGIPLHTVLAFEQGNPRTAMEDGTPYLAVIPAAEYAKTWSDAGDDTVAATISSLEALLQSQPVTPTTPLPLLPPPAGSNDIASNVKYLKGNGFEGVSFIGRTTFDASALLNFQLRYYFSGLTDDGQYVVTAQWPITSTAVPNTPEEVPAEVQKLVNDNYEQYLADETAKLNGLADDQWSVAPSQLDAMIASTSVNRSPMLSAERLANLAYPTVMLEGESVQLTDGKYEDTQNQITVMLLDVPRAFGKINGEDAAAVLTVSNGGGTGQFVSLNVVVDKLGEPTVVASTLLGDRVQVLDLQITDAGLIVVDMITQGPTDGACCPTMPMTVAYALAGSQLIDVAVVSGTIDTTPIDQNPVATIIPATPYNNNVPPSGQGEPKHPLWTWGDNDPTKVETMWGPYVAVFNVDAYKKIWADAGDPYVANTLAELEKLLAEQPSNPPPPLPILPQQPATNDLAAQVKYVDLPDGGSGIRWVGRLGQSVNPVTASDLHYYFQGLTGDGQRLIAAMVPLTSTVVPATMAEVPPDVMNAMNDADSYTAYLAGVTEQLNAATAGDFGPNLDALDQVVQSVTISTSVNPLSPVALANMTYTSTVTASGVATLVDGSYTEQAAPGSASLNGVVLLPSPMAFGELDGQQSAAVLIAEGGGGSGSFISLHVVQLVDGAPMDIASTELGDRIHVNSLNIADNQITVDMITHGPSDPACCPTQPVIQIYELQDSQLVMVSETKTETAPAAGEDPLAGTTWTWTGTLMNDGSERLPAEGVSFQLAFGTDGSLSATTDCNTFMGTYTLGADSQITIGLPASTMMACPDDAQQDAYIQDLTSIQFYLLRDGNLHLQLPFDSGTMNFAPATEGASAEATPAATETTAAESTPEATEAVLPQPAPLPGTEWLWTGNVMNDDSRVDPAQADAFKVSFAEDGSVSATTDCNTFKGTYTTGEGGTVTIELPASTRMACPEGSQQDTYIRDLTSVQSYITQDGNLYLALPVDAGNMTYTPVAP